MASTDSELISEVQELGYGPDVISDSRMGSLVSIAKSEIRASASGDYKFYQDKDAERALFWLVFLFQRVATGDIEAPEFSVAEIEQEAQGKILLSYWYKQYRAYLSSIGERTRGGLTNDQRNNRTYGTEQ